MELSAQTFDWDRFHDLGLDCVDGVRKLSVFQQALDDGILETDEATDRFTAIVREEFSDYTVTEVTNPDKTTKAATAHFKVSAPGEESPAFTLDLLLKKDELVIVIFENTLPELDQGMVFDGPITGFDADHATAKLTYAFQVKRTARETSNETLLSQRQAELYYLENDDPDRDDKQIADIMGISPSSIRTHREKLSELPERARAQKDEAEETLALLNK